ncbi:hypothetical protein [Salipiger pallidus]|uniref:hypothetical protein n=1 Tax=Salipiger pallidus TaxID=1775170 RepID=UPI00166F4D5E|nr:hypothetical protein [Salipiger pallidus]
MKIAVEPGRDPTSTNAAQYTNVSFSEHTFCVIVYYGWRRVGKQTQLLRIICRYFIVGFAALTIVFVAFTLSPAISAQNADFSACRSERSSQCLTDLGVDLALNARALPPYMREVGMLAQMGRIEDALALEFRVVSEKDQPSRNVEATVNRRLASHRITAAIRNGIDLDAAIERTPDVDAGVIWISALDLLDRNPYGVRSGPRIMPDDQILDVVSDMAERIAKMAQEEPERPQTIHLMYAAELQTALNNRTEVIRLFEALPQTRNPLINPSHDLIRLIGSQTALRLYREAGGSGHNILLTAASAETDLSLATEYLKRAFTEFLPKTPGQTSTRWKVPLYALQILVCNQLH